MLMRNEPLENEHTQTGTEEHQPIYLLFYCNEWKEYSSMRIAAASVEPDRFRRLLDGAIEQGDIVYHGNPGELYSMDIECMNSSIQYGFIKILQDGETIR